MKLGSCNGKTEPPLGLDGAGHMSDKPQVGLATYLSEALEHALSLFFINTHTLKDEHCYSCTCEASLREKEPETCV